MKNQKSKTFVKCCDYQKEIQDFGIEIHRIALELKNLQKFYRLANGFCFFVTSTYAAKKGCGAEMNRCWC